MSDVDKRGHQIAVTQGSVQELFIKQNLKQAQVVSVPDQSAALELLPSGKAHALIANRVQLPDVAAKRREFRVLDGSIHDVG
ncbi:MAG: hypothetical protein ACXW20_08760 [Burkholderiales bacterium]